MYIFLSILLLIFICFALYSAVEEKTYVIYSKKVKKDIKIALLTDLHSIYHGKEHCKLFERIKKAKPDFIALVGDIFDGKRKDDAALCFIENLPKSIPCFYVTGNHEHKKGKWRKYCEYVSENGITVLDGTTVHNDEFNISFSGVFDPQRSKSDDINYNLDDVIKNMELNFDEYNILLAHTPFQIEKYKKGNFDLILSGHTHGGQIRIPFVLNGLFNKRYNKRLGFFPPYCGGIYKHNELVHIVSRGLSNNPRWVPRVFNRKEFVNVIIKSIN